MKNRRENKWLVICCSAALCAMLSSCGFKSDLSLPEPKPAGEAELAMTDLPILGELSTTDKTAADTNTNTNTNTNAGVSVVIPVFENPSANVMTEADKQQPAGVKVDIPAQTEQNAQKLLKKKK